MWRVFRLSPGVPGVVAGDVHGWGGGAADGDVADRPTGITYSMEPPDPGDGTATVSVTVTAVLADGFEWGQLGAVGRALMR